MNPDTAPTASVRLAPPSKHQLAVMIWLAVSPTLTALNVALGDWLRDWLRDLPTVPRTFVLTIAVPIVIYGVMPHLHRARARLLRRP
jgi:antibiotic biosynthesis monooxygenase (ABM) superfamily enzyme